MTEPLEGRQLIVAHDDDVETSLTFVGSVLERFSEPFVLAIDDGQLLASGNDENVVHALVDHVPSGSQLLVATRASAAPPSRPPPSDA